MARKAKKTKRAGVVKKIHAGEEESMYWGNSAQRELAEAREAYERADAWARDPEQRPYGTQQNRKRRKGR